MTDINAGSGGGVVDAPFDIEMADHVGDNNSSQGLEGRADPGHGGEGNGEGDEGDDTRLATERHIKDGDDPMRSR